VEINPCGNHDIEFHMEKFQPLLPPLPWKTFLYEG
jgi:hypothetical protein